MPYKDEDKFREYQKSYRDKPGVRERQRATAQARRAADPERYRRRDRERYALNAEYAEKRRADAATWRKNNPQKLKHINRKHHLKQYSLTMAQWDQMLMDQDGCCANIGCNEPFGSDPNNCCIDHDHSCCPGAEMSCGECIRGLLCMKCNRGLGLLRDSKDVILGLIDYLDGAPPASNGIRHSRQLTKGL